MGLGSRARGSETWHRQSPGRSARKYAELAGTMRMHAPSLHRLLRTLAGLGILTERDGQRFALTSLGEALETGHPGSARATLMAFCGPAFWRSWKRSFCRWNRERRDWSIPRTACRSSNTSRSIRRRRRISARRWSVPQINHLSDQRASTTRGLQKNEYYVNMGLPQQATC